MNRTIQNTLKEAAQLLKRSGICEDNTVAVQNLMKKLDNRELIISVIGQFKRGKTSFINAALMEDILPVGIIPVTSVVTKIQYGRGYATVSFKSGNEETVSLDTLGEFISEQNNPENKKGVSYVNLYLPHDFLKNGLTLVDTPGVGSIHQHNTDDAYSFLTESDAIIFMISVDSPINEIERAFLAAAKNHAAKFYFTVNKIDTITLSDLNAYLGYCRNILSDLMDGEAVDLFPISARKNIGIDTLFSTIQEDLRTSADEILRDSVGIKLKEVLIPALSHIDLYNTALHLPLDNLEAKKALLTEKLENLDGIIKNASYFLSQKIDEVLERIQGALHTEATVISDDLTAILKTVYEINRDKKPKQLEEALKDVLEMDLTGHLTELSDRGLLILEMGYEEAADLLSQKIDDLKDFLKQVIDELFGIAYQYETTSQGLSEREDFYVSVNNDSGSLLLDINDFVYLLPRSYANQKIFSRFVKKMQDDVECNINNMIYNYQYKLRESVRTFNSILDTESTVLKKEIADIVNRVIADKENTSLELGEKINELNQIYKALRLCINEL
ncbi:hypothetical protein GH810_11945 [Acetobacterium paludosum]|uniref:Dynamin N-terminal domain-containing protein n=1 Tax=Acetobacterium paludosum TaxID=52693 RepID=A0A923KY05_9FIRM|nr:dynamin family protein [Acetobacterium paludosum]MBC3889026.1 hypothetical protein [Acetobacterium paludosum]